MTELQEIWKVIDGYPEYEISSWARVRSNLQSPGGRILKQVKNKNYPYWYVQLGKYTKTMSVHRVVALTFIPNPNKYPEVNHIDGNGLNNNLNNLEWCTKSQNIQHSWNMGKRVFLSPTAKLTSEEIFEIRCLRYYGATFKTIAISFGISVSQAHKVWTRMSWPNV